MPPEPAPPADRAAALAAALRATFRTVNPCLGAEHSVRLRTDAARINSTARTVERILQEHGL